MKKVIAGWALVISFVIYIIYIGIRKVISGDCGLDPTTLAALVFTSSGAAFVSIGALVKNYYGKAIDFVMNRIGFTIVAHDTLNYNEFNALSDWVNKLNKVVIRNNRAFYRYDGKGYTRIGYGNYCIHLDTLTLCYISMVQHDGKTEPYDTLSIKIIGFKKDEYVTVIKEILKSIYDHDNEIRILTPARNFYITKKNGELLAGTYYEKLVMSVNRWNKMKDYYNTYGITHKLGVLLYGNPGTGKSTLAKAIASHFSYPIYILTPQDLYNRDTVEEIRSIEKPIIVLFEDIDCVINSRETSQDKDKKYNSIFQFLLNLLDGVNSPDGIIFIATTNYKDRLDPALVRPGRFDIQMEISGLTKEEAVEMCKTFQVNPNVYLENESFPINQSKLQAKILTNTVENNIYTNV